MEIKNLWQAVSETVWTGKETETVELKCRLYDFKNENEKGEFIKDISSFANSLAQRESEGYIILGVRDATDCKNRTNQSDFILNTNCNDPDRLQLQMNQIIEEYVEPRFTIACSIIPKEVTELHDNIIAISVHGWSGINGTDQRPYVVKRNIGKLHPGSVYVRRGTRAIVADRAEILDLAKNCIQIKSIEDIEELEHSYEEKIKDIEKDYEFRIKSLQDDYENESKWNITKIGQLQKDLDELIFAERSWRHLALLACSELFDAWPKADRKAKIRSLLAHENKKAFYKDIVPISRKKM